MRKNFIILVVSVVLFSLFNTTGINFRLWDNPSINSDYINTPSIPISTQTDISIFGLLTNFFSDLTLEYPSDDIVYNEGVLFDINNPKSIEDTIIKNLDRDKLLRISQQNYNLSKKYLKETSVNKALNFIINKGNYKYEFNE